MRKKTRKKYEKIPKKTRKKHEIMRVLTTKYDIILIKIIKYKQRVIFFFFLPFLKVSHLTSEIYYVYRFVYMEVIMVAFFALLIGNYFS